MNDLLPMELPLTSSLEASPAKTSPSRGCVQGSKASAQDCGPNSIDSFATYDRATRSWRTSQTCLLALAKGEADGLDEFSETWPKSGTTRNGAAYRLPTLVPPSSVIESGSLPRPTRAMGNRGWGVSLTGRGRYSPTIIDNVHALISRYGWRPPVDLLEAQMGFPISWTGVSEQRASETPSSPKSPNSSGARF